MTRLKSPWLMEFKLESPHVVSCFLRIGAFDYSDIPGCCCLCRSTSQNNPRNPHSVRMIWVRIMRGRRARNIVNQAKQITCRLAMVSLEFHRPSASQAK